MSRCNYNSKSHGFFISQVSSVNGVTIPNIEPSSSELINLAIIKKVIKDKKKRKQLED